MVLSWNTGQGGDQALYDGFGAAGMHGASAVQPPFGQVRHEPAPASSSPRLHSHLHG
jgi:hypothetical protein